MTSILNDFHWQASVWDYLTWVNTIPAPPCYQLAGQQMLFN